MTVVFTHGDLFDIGIPVEALVNPVNCVGVMGAGLALEFKERFPSAYVAYADACSRREVVPGRIFTFKTTGPVIFHFPTKRHYRDRSQLCDIESGLVDLVEEIRKHEVVSVAIPALGCGLGGLDWEEVRELIGAAMEPLDNVRTLIFEP